MAFELVISARNPHWSQGRTAHTKAAVLCQGVRNQIRSAKAWDFARELAELRCFGEELYKPFRAPQACAVSGKALITWLHRRGGWWECGWRWLHARHANCIYETLLLAWEPQPWTRTVHTKKSSESWLKKKGLFGGGFAEMLSFEILSGKSSAWSIALWVFLV